MSDVRDPWPDTMRCLAVVLVVVGHALAPVVARSGFADAVSTGTWALRLPLLAALAGYFSSAEPPTRRSATRLLQSVGLVLVLFDLLQRVQIWALHGVVELDLTTPVFGMWFLLALLMWRIALPYLAQLRALPALAVLAALAVGFVPTIGTTLSLSRTIVFFPFFLLGWAARRHGLRERLDTRTARIGGALVLLGTVPAMAAGWSTVPMRVFQGDRPYAADVLLTDLGWRALALALGTATVLAVMALVPRRRLPFLTAAGAGSMTVYLLHQPIHRALGDLGLYRAIDGRTDLLALVLGAVAVALLLATPPVRRATRWAVQPRGTWLLTRDAAAAVRPVAA